MNRVALALGVVVLAWSTVGHAEFSSDLDKLWDYGKPAESEARFRAERARWPAGSREALETDTQIARALGLQQRYDEAHALLDRVARRVPNVSARIDVRQQLERGRVFNSSGKPAQAFVYFVEAEARARDDPEPGAEFYRIDALHMLAIAAPESARVAWNRKALQAAEAATEPRARGWRASILNNLGFSLLDNGDANAALDAWRQALALREASGDVGRTREARWAVARGLRATGQLDEAERMQRQLAAELQRAGESDADAVEELAEIAKARGAR